MICKFCNEYIKDLRDIASVNSEEFSVYSIYCDNCKIHYKLDNKNNILFIIIEYKSCRILFLYDKSDSPECILQIGGTRFTNLSQDTINLSINQIHNKIDKLLPFI